MLSCRGFARQGWGSLVVLVTLGTVAGCGNGAVGSEGDQAAGQGNAPTVGDPAGGSPTQVASSANAAGVVEHLKARYTVPATAQRKVRPGFLPKDGLPQSLFPQSVADSMIREGARLLPSFPSN